MKITAEVLKDYQSNSKCIDALQESIDRTKRQAYLYDEPETALHAARLESENRLIKKWLNQIAELKAKNEKIETWAARIADPVIKKSVILHYLQGYTWQQTTAKVTNGYTDPHTLAKSVRTFIEKNA